MPDPHRPHGLQLTRPLRPWVLQARALEWAAVVGGVLTPGPLRKSHVPSFLDLRLTCLPEIQRPAFSCGSQTCGHGQGRAGRARRGALTQTHGRVWSRQLLGSCCMTHGAQLGALCRPRARDRGREGGSGGNRCMCTYGRFALLSSRS